MPWPTNGRAWAFRLVLWLALRQNPQKAIPDHRANQRFQPQDNLYILPEIIAFQTTIFPKTTFPYFKSKAQNHRFPRKISAFLHSIKSAFSRHQVKIPICQHTAKIALKALKSNLPTTKNAIFATQSIGRKSNYWNPTDEPSIPPTKAFIDRRLSR